MMKFKKLFQLSIITCLFISGVATTAIAQESKTQQESPKIASAAKNVRPPELFDDADDLWSPHFTDEGDIVGEELYPSEDIYQIWMNENVNPYGVSIKELDDSILIDCSGYVHPLEEGAITSNYGPRGRRFHQGIDLRLKTGQDVYAAFDGKIRITGYDKYGYGYYVVIRHSNGLETLYGHLSKIKVEDNQDVKAGDLIAAGGSTGRSTGPHLHFEFRYLGNAINPAKLVNFEKCEMLTDSYLLSKTTSFKELLSYQKAKYHYVRSGETLSSIARRYGTTVSSLCRLNKIKSTSVLRIKQRIRYS